MSQNQVIADTQPGGRNISVPKPEFQLAEVEGGLKKIKAIAAVDTYLVNYIDGEGKNHTRLCFDVPGSDSVFILQGQINGVFVSTASQPWFQKEFKDELQRVKATSGEIESV